MNGDQVGTRKPLGTKKARRNPRHQKRIVWHGTAFTCVLWLSVVSPRPWWCFNIGTLPAKTSPLEFPMMYIYSYGKMVYLLVVSTHLKNGNLPQIGVKIKIFRNHHLVYLHCHRSHVWYIYLHLPETWSKCRNSCTSPMDPMGFFCWFRWDQLK